MPKSPFCPVKKAIGEPRSSTHQVSILFAVFFVDICVIIKIIRTNIFSSSTSKIMKTSRFILGFGLLATVLLSTAFTPINLKKMVKNKAFKSFLSHFDSKALPYNITLSDVKNHIAQAQSSKSQAFTEEAAKAQKLFYKKQKEQSDAISNSTFLPEAFQGLLNRMGPPIFEPVAQFELKEDMIGVIYTSSRRFDGYLKNYKILIYNQQGEILNLNTSDEKSKLKIKRYYDDTFLIAYTSVQESMTFKIDKQGHIWQNKYEHQWVNDYENCPIQENTLEDFKLIETKVFNITKEGKIEEMKEHPVVAKV